VHDEPHIRIVLAITDILSEWAKCRDSACVVMELHISVGDEKYQGLNKLGSRVSSHCRTAANKTDDEKTNYGLERNHFAHFEWGSF
jgi:hypothetical protein